MDSDEQFVNAISSSATNRANNVHVRLAKAIHRHKDIIINPPSSIPREKLSQEKERAWEAIRAEMVDAGVQRFATRTWRTVRDVDWQHLRRRVVNKLAENMRLYQTPNKDFSELDILVLDTMGKLNADGTVNYNDLVKVEAWDERPKSVSGENSENGFETDSPLVVSTNSLLAEMIGDYRAQNNEKKTTSLQTDSVKRKRRANDEPNNEQQPANEEANGQSHDVRLQWENLLLDLGIGRNPRENDKEPNQLETFRLEQERYKTEAEKFRTEQERYKVLQEKWKSEIEKIRLEEAKIRFSRLKSGD